MSPLPRRLRSLGMVTALNLALAVAAIVLGLIGWRQQHPPATADVTPQVTAAGAYEAGSVNGMVDPALTAAVQATTYALSYDFRRLDAGVAAATSRMTAPYAAEFRNTFDASARPLAIREKAVTQARIRAAAVVRNDGDTATCLIYVDQVLVSSTDLADAKDPVRIGQNRVVVRMKKIGDAWLMDSMEPR